MKKFASILLSAATLLICACTTNVTVDSAAYPMASYDGISGKFSGKLSGTINNVFKATNIAIERDLKYFRVGQTPGDNMWTIRARAELDHAIVVIIKQMPNDEINVDITYDSGDLMKSQEIFNAIAKNTRLLERR